MQVNKNIYPTTNEDETRDLTISVGDMPINTQIDESIVYSASTSKNAPWTNYGICEGWSYNTQYLQPGEENGTGGVIMKTGSGIQRQILIGSTGNTHQMYINENSLYNNRQAYAISDKLTQWNSINPVSAFKYYTTVACIYVVSVKYENPLAFWSHDLDTYVKEHSNEKMVGAFIRLFHGTEKSRTTEWYFANYDEIVLTQIGKDPSNPNEFTITNTENIINHTPFNIESVGGILCGITSIHSTTYKYSLLNSYNLGMYYNIDSYNIDKTQMYGSGNYGHMRLPVDSNIDVDKLLSMCATYGVLFTTSETLAKGGSNGLDLSNESKEDRSKGLFSDDLYFPIKEENGLWQGRWAHGLNNENTEQYKNKWNSDKNAPFENGSPHVEPGENFGDDNFSGIVSNTSGFVHRYFVNHSEMKQIATYLNNTDTDLLSSIVKNISMSGDNPINSITSVMYSPINFDFKLVGDVIIGCNYVNIGTTENPIALGANVVDRDNYTIELGEMFIQPTFKNYLDYEPYTKYIAYIPFCNFVELESNIITNKTLRFTMFFDLITGTCECAIRVNGLLYKSVSGNFATQCSIQGYDNSTYSANAMASAGKMVGGAGAVISAAVTGNLLVGAAGAASYLSGLYDFATTPKTYETAGKSTGLLSQNYPLHVCVYRLAVSDISDENYGNFVGYACEFSEKLGNLSGLTVCANALVECNATNTEKEKIKELLESGVYL